MRVRESKRFISDMAYSNMTRLIHMWKPQREKKERERDRERASKSARGSKAFTK